MKRSVQKDTNFLD